MFILRFLTTFFLFFLTTVQAEIPEKEHRALIEIIDSNDIYFYDDFTESTDKVCMWQRVGCDEGHQHIVELNFSGLGITQLASQIALFPALERLNLSGNMLVTLPSEIGMLTALKELSLESNQLKSLPTEIGQLKALEKLNLNYNLLVALPLEMGQLKRLKILSLNANQITDLPPEITLLNSLTTLEFKTNWQRTKYNENKVSIRTRELAGKIQQHGKIYGSAVGIGGDRTEQYDNFIALKLSATQDELIELVNHPSPAVRGYAVWALTERQEFNLLPVILEHLNDNETVSTLFGCFGKEWKSGDYLIGLATPKWNEQNSTKLTQTQLKVLDHALINLPNGLMAKDEALKRIKPTAEIYSRIRELAVKENNPAALVALARYQKEEDIPLILNNQKYKGYFTNLYINQAIEIFPHPDFFPLLREQLLVAINNKIPQGEVFLQELYLAIARYQNKEALALITTELLPDSADHQIKEHYQSKFCALRKLKSPFFDDLLWELWGKEKILTPDILAYLTKDNPEKAFKLVKQSLQNIDKLFESNSFLHCNDLDGQGENAENVTNAMLDIAIEKVPTFVFDIIRKNIIEDGVYGAPIFFVKKALEIKDSSFNSPLLVKLEKGGNYSLALDIARTLFALKNKDIDRRTIKAINQNSRINLKRLKQEDGVKQFFSKI